MISLDDFVSFRAKYCQQHHSVSCKGCHVLVDIAKYILDEGIVRVSCLYRKFFPNNTYKSDKAVRRLLQLPVAIFGLEGQPGYSELHVTGYYPSIDYKRLRHLINKLVAPGQVSGLDKNTLSALCKLASSEKDRALVKFAACEAANLTSRQAQKIYGIGSYKELGKKVRVALAEAAEIRQSILDLAEIEDKALLQSLRLQDVDSEDVEDVNMDDHDDNGELDIDSCEEMSIDEVSGKSDEEGTESSYVSNPCTVVDQSANTTSQHLMNSPDSLLLTNSADSDQTDVGGTPLLSPVGNLGHSCDPDIIDKTTLIANPAPSHDVLLSWLRDSDLNWFEFFEEVSQYLRNYTSEVLNQVILDFTDFLPTSDLSLDEEKRVEVSRQAFLEMQRRRRTDSPDIESDSDNDQDSDWNGVQILDVLGKETLEKIQSERVRIKRRAERKIAKEITEKCILKRKVPPAVSRLQKKFPSIGKDMEDFVESKKVGADAWRRTGLLTFDGERRRGKKVTYQTIKDHLEAKYSTKFGYGSIVQLCCARNKRHRSSSRYQNVAKITCRRARKGFSVRLNPDAHWSCALYRGLDCLQLQDGSNKMLLNRDDQSGFRLDTTYDHKHSKSITTSNNPALTTRTDFVNSYPSVLQTTSYLFMETATSKQACVGMVKPHHIFPKNAAQHAADLELLQNSPDMEPWMCNKPIDCIRVDGASDEGPCHVEVQFYWTERHVKYEKVATLVTSRHSGGSYLNRVELMNGGLSQAHSNLFIPSTLSGSNFGPAGLDQAKLKENLELATEVYIDRVQGASCCGSPVQLFKGAVAYMTRRQHLLTFLKGSKKAKQELQADDPELYKCFEDIWNVRNRHMNKSVPPNYIFHLTLCGEPECIHPRCKRGETSSVTKWYQDGPSVTWLPIPVPDPKRIGHFKKPEDLMKSDGTETRMMSPPSALLKAAAKDNSILQEVEDLAQKVLLPVQEVKWHLDHYQMILEKRKGVQKASKKKTQENDSLVLQDSSIGACSTCIGKADLICSADACNDRYCLDCLGLSYTPPMKWICPPCQDETELFCLCRQGEYGLMVGCDGKECNIAWFHVQCVGLKGKPKTKKWLCPLCK